MAGIAQWLEHWSVAPVIRVQFPLLAQERVSRSDPAPCMVRDNSL